MGLPTLEDFTTAKTPEEDLDGYSAWENFGGLSLDEAYAKFCEFPETHQEDFMWMGNRAFVFYFPVVDRYIREKESAGEFDGETYILAHDIGIHLPAVNSEIRSVYHQLSKLCDFVLEGLSGLREREDRSRPVHEIASVWRDVRAKLDR